MNWILLLVLLAALVIFVKTTNRGQNVWSYAIVAGAIIVLVSILYVGTSVDINLQSLDGLVSFGKLYLSWLGQVAGNFGSITGNAVNLDWGLGLNNSNASSIMN